MKLKDLLFNTTPILRVDIKGKYKGIAYCCPLELMDCNVNIWRSTDVDKIEVDLEED